MTAPTQRVEALEAEAFRTSRQLVDVNFRLDHMTERLDHLTSAIGDLSGDQREFRHDVREQLAGLAHEQTRQGAVLAAIAKKLGVEDQDDERTAAQ